MKKQSLPQDHSELDPILHLVLSKERSQGQRLALSSLRCIIDLECTGIRELGNCGEGVEGDPQFKLRVEEWSLDMAWLAVLSASSCPA